MKKHKIKSILPVNRNDMVILTKPVLGLSYKNDPMYILGRIDQITNSHNIASRPACSTVDQPSS